MTEEWRAVEDFPGYEVSSMGKVRSLCYNNTLEIRNLCQQKCRGYYYCGLNKDGKKYFKRVHRLVAEAFLENPHKYPQVDHINHDPYDNRLENLEWVPASENCLRKRSFGYKGTNTGYNNISKKTDEERFVVYKQVKYKSVYKSFKTLEEAIAFRDSL